MIIISHSCALLFVLKGFVALAAVHVVLPTALSSRYVISHTGVHLISFTLCALTFFFFSIVCSFKYRIGLHGNVTIQWDTMRGSVSVYINVPFSELLFRRQAFVHLSNEILIFIWLVCFFSLKWPYWPSSNWSINTIKYSTRWRWRFVNSPTQ